MKISAPKTTTNKRATAPRLRRTPCKESELPPEAQEFRRKFREWDESFQSRAKRMASIRKLCRRIAEAYEPEKIILFGSHAYGTPTPASDVDLLIVMDYEGCPVEQSLRIDTELDIVAPVDLLIYSPPEVQARLLDGDMFMVQICERGKVMYENKHGRMDRESRR